MSILLHALRFCARGKESCDGFSESSGGCHQPSLGREGSVDGFLQSHRNRESRFVPKTPSGGEQVARQAFYEFPGH